MMWIIGIILVLILLLVVLGVGFKAADDYFWD